MLVVLHVHVVLYVAVPHFHKAINDIEKRKGIGTRDNIQITNLVICYVLFFLILIIHIVKTLLNSKFIESYCFTDFDICNVVLLHAVQIFITNFVKLGFVQACPTKAYSCESLVLF